MDAKSSFLLVCALSRELTDTHQASGLSASLLLQMTPSMHCLVEVSPGWQPWPFLHFEGERSGPSALVDRELLSILGEGGHMSCQHQPAAPDWLLRGLALPICISLSPPAQSTLS